MPMELRHHPWRTIRVQRSSYAARYMLIPFIRSIQEDIQPRELIFYSFFLQNLMHIQKQIDGLAMVHAGRTDPRIHSLF